MPTHPNPPTILELLGTDTSNPKVRLAWCVACLLGGPLIAAAYTLLLPHPSFIAFFQIASPLSGLLGSFLWLAWTWMRSDIESAKWQIVYRFLRSSQDHKNTVADPQEAVGDTSDVIIKITSDRAEKIVYLFVGITLALACFFALPPTISAFYEGPDRLGDEVSVLRKQLMVDQQAIGELKKRVQDQGNVLEELRRTNLRVSP